MKEYTVNINDKEYSVAVKNNNIESTNNTAFSEELSYESIKSEYEHCVQRSERLDNKIYIILTVFAFIFVLICDVIKKIESFSFPTSASQLALIVTYSVLLTINILIYVFTLIQLTKLLKGISIRRFNPTSVLSRDMINSDSKTVARYICSQYNICIDSNNEILEKKFKKFNDCVNYIIPIIINSILLIFISEFIY